MMKCLTLTCLAFVLTLPAFAADEDNGFKAIFNGKNLDGWIGDGALWRVEDGHIIGQTTEDKPTGGNTFLIWEEGQPDDFELRFRYRLESEWANSGVQVRSEHHGDYRVRGYQPDIASEDWITGIHYEEGGRGILARRGEKAVFGADGSKQVTRFAAEDDLSERINKDDWNEYHVIARGDTIITKINGVKMHEVVDTSPKARRSGVIAFQLHQGPPMMIRIEDVKVKPLGREAE
ncbi:MAG: 3-keto-disaccharide hydrolase [Planctomycetota bacterium]